MTRAERSGRDAGQRRREGWGNPPQPKVSALDDERGWKRYLTQPDTKSYGVVGVHPTALPQDHELAAAKRIAAGFDVFFRERVEADGVANPDLLIEGLIWELKSPRGAGRNNISAQMRRAKRQADRVIIDLARSPRDELGVDRGDRPTTPVAPRAA